MSSLRWRVNVMPCHPRSLIIELTREEVGWWSFVVAFWWRKIFIQYRGEGS